MQVIVSSGKKCKTYDVRSRPEAVKLIISKLNLYKKEGESIVWTKVSKESKQLNRASIVSIGGQVQIQQAQITGGSKMAEKKKVLKKKIESKSTPAPATKKAVKKNAPTANKVAKIAKAPGQNELIAGAFVKLPKSGKLPDDIAAQVHAKTGGNLESIKDLVKARARFVSYMVILPLLLPLHV